VICELKERYNIYCLFSSDHTEAQQTLRVDCNLYSKMRRMRGLEFLTSQISFPYEYQVLTVWHAHEAVHPLLSQNWASSQLSGWMETERGKWSRRLKSQKK